MEDDEKINGAIKSFQYFEVKFKSNLIKNLLLLIIDRFYLAVFWIFITQQPASVGILYLHPYSYFILHKNLVYDFIQPSTIFN